MIMVDAFRHDYITEEDSPFLFHMAQNHAHGALIPSFGFEPDAAYFSGLDPEECDGGAQYWRKPGDRVFYLTRLFHLLHLLPSDWWRKNIRRGVRLIAQLASNDALTKMLAPSSQIPLSVLSQFSFSMKSLPCDPGFTPSPTIFDILRQNDLNFFYHGYPLFKVNVETVVDRYIKEEQGGNALAFLFIGTLDGIAHRHGPSSPQRRAALKHVDKGIAEIYAHAKRNYAEADLLVFGDHGMVDVSQTVDLRPTIAKAGLDPKEDSYFLDSTFARFWVSENDRRKSLVSLLDRQPNGHVLIEEEVERYRIRYGHNYFGDVIFAVDDGVLIHPCYYDNDTTALKGMHGYLPGCRDNESAFLLSSSRASGLGNLDRIDMRRVFPTVLDLLNLYDGYPVPHNLTSFLR